MKVLFTDQDMGDVTLERSIFQAAGIELLEAQCKTEDDVIAHSAGCEALLIQYAPVNAKVFAARPEIGSKAGVLFREQRGAAIEAGEVAIDWREVGDSAADVLHDHGRVLRAEEAGRLALA